MKVNLKSELALNKVNKGISFTGEQSDTYETERRKRENKKEELNGKVSDMDEKIEELENKIDRQEKHLKKSCILIYGTIVIRNGKMVWKVVWIEYKLRLKSSKILLPRLPQI